MAKVTGNTFDWEVDMDNIEFPPDADGGRDELTNPPQYAILLQATHEDITVYAVYPNIDPKDPKDYITELAVSPATVSTERIVNIYKDLEELGKNEKDVKFNIIHLSKVQATTLALVGYDQQGLFDYSYDGDVHVSTIFNVTACCKLIDE